MWFPARDASCFGVAGRTTSNSAAAPRAPTPSENLAVAAETRAVTLVRRVFTGLYFQEFPLCFITSFTGLPRSSSATRSTFAPLAWANASLDRLRKRSASLLSRA